MAMKLIAALLSFSVSLAASQSTDQAAAAVQTFRPSADTYVDQAYPNRSFGSAKRLRVGAGSRPAKQVYVRFAVAGLAGSVTRAILRFYVTNGTRDGPAVYKTGAWPRKSLTWARRPAVVSGPRGNKGALVHGTWAEWDVTPWVTRDGVYRFALKGGTADAAGLVSRETAVQTLQPQLVVTTSSGVVYVAPTQGATVSGVTTVRVWAPVETNWIGVYACGKSYEDHVKDANGQWSVQWDTRTACSNGMQDVDTWAFRDGSALGNTAITVQVSNSSPPPPDPEPTPCAPTPEPGPVAGQGYTLRFSDCFGTLSRSVWCSNQWWEPTPPPDTQYVAGGALHLVRRRSDGYVNVTVSTEPCGQANPKSFQYGYMEARMRYDTVRGNGPAFWMLSTRHATNPNFPNIHPDCAGAAPDAPCLTSELDIFEGFGNIQYGGSRTDDFFSGALHRNTGEFYGQPNQFRFVQRGTGLDLSQWHTYAALWTDSTVSYYIDGQVQGSVNTFDSTRQPMHLLLYNWNTEWEGENMPNASTPDQLDVSVDWVRVWQQ
jgi:Glycosyl hydrolases family 16